MAWTRQSEAALAGAVTLVVATAILLLLGAATGMVDDLLGIGTHQSSTSNLSVMSITGTGPTVLVPANGRADWGPAWSPTGHDLVYTLGNPTTHVDPLVLTEAHGTGREVLTHDGRSDYLAAWSHNGRRIAYITQQGEDERTADLAVINADGSDPGRLTHNHAFEYGASWSPDGRWIAYGSQQGGSWHVWIVHPDGTDAHILAGTEAGNAPDWSPDGRTIAFTSDRTGNDNIYSVSAQGGIARRLTTGPCHSDNARWSPDGTRLTFAAFCPGGWNDVEIMNADGSHVVNLTHSATREEEVPAWLPDGRQIGFAVFQVERDSLWPGPALKALGAGLILGLLAAGLVLFRPRTAQRSRP